MVQYRTYFRKPDAGNSSIVPDPHIVISCVDRRWNDFGRNYRAKFAIEPRDGRAVFACDLQVMPIVDGKPVGRLDKWIEAIGTSDPASEYVPVPLNEHDKIQFLSLFAKESDYRDLSRWSINYEETCQILMAISDVVFARTNSLYQTEALAGLLNSEEFRLAMLRSGSAYQAFHRAGYKLGAAQREHINDARTDFEFQCTLKGFESSNHGLNFEFIETPLYEDRIHCLIGVNGTGKTRLLKELILTLGRQADNSGLGVFIDNFYSEASSDAWCSAPGYNRVLAFSAESRRNFPSDTRGDSKFEYRHFTLVQPEGNAASLSSGSNTIPWSGGAMARMLVSMLRDPETLSDTTDSTRRFDLLTTSLRGHMNLEVINIPMIEDAKASSHYVWADGNGNCWITLHHLNYAGGEQKALELSSMVDEERELAFFDDKREKIYPSSGQLAFFRFALHFLSYADDGTLVIVDEPETHLHPNLVCDFMSLLHNVLSLTKSIGLIATHSPYIVREVPTHCVHVLTRDEDRQVQIGGVYLKTLGASVSSISHAVFGDATVQKYHQKIAKQLASTEQTLDELIELYKEILSPEILIQIRKDLDSKGLQR